MARVEPLEKSLCLEQLCASNYRKLLRLVPDLHRLEQSASGSAQGKPDLQLTILDKAPYTLTLQLSHCFGQQHCAPLFEPALKIRVYLDAQLAEVLRDHHRPDAAKAVGNPAHSRAIMDHKWTLNYFLDKWLNHCLQVRYRFHAHNGKAAALG